ncbi:MAG: ferredoxin:glutaredoxin reductase [Candidatus Bipolaricaulota bacterium]|nr:ferredoxin:glutaredoxin reductase [Candidatus Bipolaricaulota bacterium]
MTPAGSVSPEAIDALRIRLDREAESAGYHLNPDLDDADRDIVCPCDYRDADLVEWGSCFCGLYVSDEIRRGTKTLTSVPERRAPAAERRATKAEGTRVWRCRVCGYLCAREHPPAVCPICKATSDRFEAFGQLVLASAGRGG